MSAARSKASHSYVLTRVGRIPLLISRWAFGSDHLSLLTVPHEPAYGLEWLRILENRTPQDKMKTKCFLSAPQGLLVGAGVVLVPMLLLTGCQTPVKTEFNSARDFSAYKTFALLPLPQTSPTSDPELIARLSEPVRTILSNTLTAKGYQEAPEDTADFTVNLRGASLPRVDVRTSGYLYPVGRWQRNYGAPVRRVDVRAYEERTLAVEIFDNKTKELAWVGWLTEDSNAPVKTDKVVEAIRRVLAGFPPGGVTSPK